MASEFKIDGRVYRFEPLVGWEAWDALQLMLKLIGPFAPLLGAINEPEDGKRSIAMAEIIPQVLKSHDDEAARELLRMFLRSTRINGDEPVIGVAPATLDEIFTLFAKCLEAQFLPFLRGNGVAGVLGMLAKAA